MSKRTNSQLKSKFHQEDQSYFKKAKVGRKWGFPDSSVGKELPEMQETLVQFLGLEDLLQKG